MEKFTASDDVTVVVPLDDGGVDVGVTRGKWDRIDARFVSALREFFQAERDEELGRWRWPENPEVVVWKSVRSNELDITVLDEATGFVGYYDRKRLPEISGDLGRAERAAHAYFDAHPEPKPLPTEPGSVLQGTGTNRTILHRSYPVNGRESDRPWTTLGGATYADEDVPEFFHGKFIQLVPKEDS